VYEESIRNLGLALHRLINSRNPAVPGECAALYEKQARALPRYYQLFDAYSKSLAQHLVDYQGALIEEMLRYAEKHPKRELRIRAFLQALREGELRMAHRCIRGKVKVKFKYEVAKVGKVPRTVVDLGVLASLVAAWMVKGLKTAMARTPFRLGNISMHFIPTSSYKDLKDAFDLLRNPQSEYVLVLFSDDSTLACRRGHQIVWFDLDISACDKSHTHELFMCLRNATPSHLRPEMDVLLAQLRCPASVRNPTNSKERFTLIPKCEFLYSGSLVTTVTNNIAVMCIGLSVASHQAKTVDEIRVAAADIGYVLTIVERHDFESVQFLKHSPVEDVNGVYQPALNMGVFLRAAGIVVSDLPGRQTVPIVERARAQHAALLSCCWPNTTFPLLARAREKFGPPTLDAIRSIEKSHYRFSERGTWPRLEFTDDSILRRYLPVRPQSDLYDFFCGATFHRYSGPTLDAILYKDYSLRCLSEVGTATYGEAIVRPC